MNDFYQKIKNMYLTDYGKEYNTIRRYQMFRSLFGDKITLNLDNMVFEQNIGIETLKTYCKEKFKKILQEFKKIGYHQGNIVEATKNEIIIELTNAIKFRCDINDAFNLLKECSENIEDLFGRGQFPIMVIHVIKIGNVNYHYYTIHR